MRPGLPHYNDCNTLSRQSSRLLHRCCLWRNAITINRTDGTVYCNAEFAIWQTSPIDCTFSFHCKTLCGFLSSPAGAYSERRMVFPSIANTSFSGIFLPNVSRAYSMNTFSSCLASILASTLRSVSLLGMPFPSFRYFLRFCLDLLFFSQCINFLLKCLQLYCI